jgi:hypothetical protein
MRAVGFGMGPTLLVIGIMDVPLFLGSIPSMVYLGVLLLMAFHFLASAGLAVSRSHQISLIRGLLVALLPTVLLVATTAVRVLPELDDLPMTPEPPSPYFVP